MQTHKRRYTSEDAKLTKTDQSAHVSTLYAGDERSHKLALVEVESFGCLGVEGGY